MKGYLLEVLQNRHSVFIGFICICLLHILYNCPNTDQLGTLLYVLNHFLLFGTTVILVFLNTGTDPKRQTPQESC